MDKEKKPPGGNFCGQIKNKNWVVWTQWAAICLEELSGGISPQEHHTYCQAWWYYNAVGKVNGIINQMIGSWVELGVPMRQWPQKHIKSSKGRAKSCQNGCFPNGLSEVLTWTPPTVDAYRKQRTDVKMVKGHLTKYHIYCMYIFDPADLVTFSEDHNGSIVTQASLSRVSCRNALTL